MTVDYDINGTDCDDTGDDDDESRMQKINVTPCHE